MDYKQKYLKYKSKYLALRGGVKFEVSHYIKRKNNDNWFPICGKFEGGDPVDSPTTKNPQDFYVGCKFCRGRAKYHPPEYNHSYVEGDDKTNCSKCNMPKDAAIHQVKIK